VIFSPTVDNVATAEQVDTGSASEVIRLPKTYGRAWLDILRCLFSTVIQRLGFGAVSTLPFSLKVCLVHPESPLLTLPELLRQAASVSANSSAVLGFMKRNADSARVWSDTF
jgi:hypothetical protein